VIKDLVKKSLALGRSTTFQEARQEGKIQGRREGARQVVLLLGTMRFGPPDPAILADLEAIEDFSRFEALVDRIVDADADNWDDLLRTP
jgi:hypothetical protein